MVEGTFGYGKGDSEESGKVDRSTSRLQFFEGDPGNSEHFGN